MKKTIDVIVVDDSALIRALLKDVLNSDPNIDVVAVAKDAFEARELIKRHNPDVITLDIEMPKMNGIAFLENIMRLRPMPVVMISTLTQEGAPATLKALEVGAVDFVAKPKTGSAADLDKYRDLIIEKVKTAARANIKTKDDQLSSNAQNSQEATLTKLVLNKSLNSNLICAIGASTGGTEAIKEIVKVLPENCPPIVIAQHIPPSFSRSFANRLDGLSKLKIQEATNNQPLQAGNVYIAPGDSHLRIIKSGSRYMCKLDQGETVNRHRPSVEVLFDSVIQAAGKEAMGVILTGMGADGSEALLRMRQKGIYTVAQDENSSVVWGMPGTAVKLGAAQKVISLHKIAAEIINVSFK